MALQNRKLNVGALLPHTKLYGGVKRFLEIGNVFVGEGHQFTLFTQDGSFSGWFPYEGLVKTFDNLLSEEFDILFFCQPYYLDKVIAANAKRKVFYLINPKLKIGNIVKHKEIELFANSTGIKNMILRKYKVQSFPAFGGINLSYFNYKEPQEKDTNDPFVVMAYGRISKPKKGTLKVVKACEKLYRRGVNIRLLLFDSPTDQKAEETIKKFKTIVPFDFILNHPVNKNQELFHRADVFVSAETSGGWSNTSAEAMACGTPVVATNVGTQDFLIPMETGFLLNASSSRQIRKALVRLINDLELRKKFSKEGRKQIELFDWQVLTRRIIAYLGNN